MSQTANTLQRSYLAHYVINVPASGQEVEKNITGVFFSVAEQLSENGRPFEAAIDDEPFFPASLGLKFTLAAGNTFRKLRFRNPTGEALVIHIYAGSVETEDMRLNIVRGRAAPTMEAQSVITDHSATIPAGGEVDLTAAPPPNERYIRKATIIFNMDPAVDLDVANSADEVFAPVFFRQGLNLETSDPVKVQNSSGAPIVARISQLWYVVN